ncbi:MAG TPA: hypothetical protein VGK35_00560 [Actinotalea sp.]
MSVPAASQAADIWIQSHGGIGATYKTSSYGARTGAYAEDTAADAHSVRVYHRRASTTFTLNDTNGSAPGTYTYSERREYISMEQMCVVNSNPFDWQYCSDWYA